MLSIDEDPGDDPRVRIRVLMDAADGTPLAVYPDPPLDGVASINGQPPDFMADLMALYGGADLPGLRGHMKDRANERNIWLYASEKGLPTVGGSIEPGLAVYRGNVFSLLAFFLLIDEHPKVQGLLAQVLAAYLRVIDTLGIRSRSRAAD